MNYIKEINAFYIEVETNPLSTGAGMLWHTLLHINNRARWVSEFSVAAAVLCYKSGLSSSSFKRARTELKEKGYITFTSRGSKAPIYQMISLVKKGGEDGAGEGAVVVEQDEREAVDHVSREVSGEAVAFMGAQVNQQVSEEMDTLTDEKVSQVVSERAGRVVSPLYKQKEMKKRQKETNTNTSFKQSDLYVFYTEHFGKPNIFVELELTDWCSDLGTELVREALERAVVRKKTVWSYAKGILKKWKEDRLFSVVDVLKAEEKFLNKRSSNTFVRKKETQTEVIPAWFREMKEQERKEKMS